MSTTPEATVIIPWRDRGTDPLRAANLARVLEWWKDSPWPVEVVDDGRSGDQQFNRSAAYNRGAATARTRVLVYTEADMLIEWHQIGDAVNMATRTPGLVVPFDTYRYMGQAESLLLRDDASIDPATMFAETTKRAGRSIGAVNVISRDTLTMIGRWDERFEGNWYDDDAHKVAFERCAGPTRWVPGPAHHLYHLPGWAGDHLSPEDKAATVANRNRYRAYRRARSPETIWALTMEEP